MTPAGPTSGPDPLPRLADALTEVSGRLHDIGAELRTLQLVAAAPAAPPAAARPVANEPAAHPHGTEPAASARRAAAAPAAFPPPPVSWAQPGPSPAPPYAFPYAQPGYPPPPRYTSPPYGAPQYPPAFTRATPAQFGGPAHAGAAQRGSDGPGAARPPWAPRERTTLWDRLSREGAGSRLLAWVGGGVTLAGVVLLLVLAVQRGYLGPLPRLLVGAGLGAALVGIALRLHRTADGRIGALAVGATGFAGLYLDVVAATSIYRYLPAPAGLLAGLVVAGAGTAIAARWRSEVFAVFVVLACALTAPIVTHGVGTLVVGFLLVLQIAATPVHLARRWSVLAPAAAVPPLLAVLGTIGLAHRDHHDAATVVALCVLTGVVQLVAATVGVLRSTDARVAAAQVLAAPVPTLIGVSLIGRGPGAAVVAAMALLLALVWVLHRARVLPVPHLVAVAAGAGAAVATLESLALALTGAPRAAALIGAAVLFALAAERLRYRLALVPALAFGAVGADLALGGALRPTRVAIAPTHDVTRAVVAGLGVTGLLLAAAAIAIAWAAGRVATSDDPQTRRTVWTIAAAVALYGLSSAVLSVGLAFSPDHRGFLAGHVLVTVSWTVGALVLLLRHAGSTPLRVAGLALVGAAVAKLVLFDLSSLSGIPRVLAFLGAGLVLLAAGARYASAAAPRVAGGSTYRS